MFRLSLANARIGTTSFTAERSTVLSIVAEDLRVELGRYGSPTKTPNLDALARPDRFQGLDGEGGSAAGAARPDSPAWLVNVGARPRQRRCN